MSSKQTAAFSQSLAFFRRTGLAVSVMAAAIAVAGCTTMSPRERLILPNESYDTSGSLPPPSLLDGASRSSASSQRKTLNNLSVEVRSREVQAEDIQDIGVNGAGVVISQRGAQGQIQGRVNSTQSTGRVTASQRLMVMNGGTGTIMMGQSKPWRFQQVIWTAQGPVATAAQGWIETGRGFQVTPRWLGQGMVAVDITAQQDTPSTGATGRTVTQIQTPLDEWTIIASSDEQSDQQQRQLLGRLDRSQAKRSVLEIRVSSGQ